MQEITQTINEDTIDIFVPIAIKKRGGAAMLMMPKNVKPEDQKTYFDDKLIKTIGFDERVRNGIDLDLWIRMLRLNPKVTLNFGDYIRQQSHRGPRLTTNLSNRILGLENTLSMWTSEQLLDPRFQKCWPIIRAGYHHYLERSFWPILMSDLLRLKTTII